MKIDLPDGPIDVRAFMERPGLPDTVKARVRAAGRCDNPEDDVAAAQAYRRMQAQILIEAYQDELAE